jgi:uncharacterized membrane-anchored protein YjiN (DUF445 family)
VRAQIHVDNQHAALLDSQVEEMDRVRREVDHILEHTSRALLRDAVPDLQAVAAWNQRLEELAHEFDRNQIARIKDNSSKTRLSILFYSYIWDSQKIAGRATKLFTMFQESLEPERSSGGRVARPAVTQREPVGSAE